MTAPTVDLAAGCLVAGAVGDALGGPVEFLSIDEIRRRYGPAGTTGYDVSYGRRSAITADTRRGHQETIAALDAAARLAPRDRPGVAALDTLGGGRTGEEALAIAVCCALTANDLADGLLLAVNHSGDSHSTGSLCGNLLGARDGIAAVPQGWFDELELGDLIADTARSLAADRWPEGPGPR